MKDRKLVIVGVALAIAVLAGPVVARAQGMMGPGYGWGMHGQTQAAGSVNIDQAVNLVRQTLARYGNPDLVPVEIMEFSNGFYVVVAEKSTKVGAIELIVERNGFVHPEPGPNVRAGERPRVAATERRDQWLTQLPHTGFQ